MDPFNELILVGSDKHKDLLVFLKRDFDVVKKLRRSYVVHVGYSFFPQQKDLHDEHMTYTPSSF
jgi:hypothetical protein